MLLESLISVFSPMTILWIVIASVVGALIGAMPGLTATMGVALFIPLTFSMDAGTALCVLGAVYASASYGGNITAILIRTPGTPDSVFMTLDGYPMVQRGEAGKALAITTIGAFFGGIVGAVALLFIAPPLSKIALRFGPAEIFFTTMLGIVIILGLTKENMLKGLISALLGFLFSTIGLDSLTGNARFTFNNINLFDGLDTVPVVIGLYAFAQVLNLIEKNKPFATYDENLGKVGIPFKELKEHISIMIKSSIIGTFVGIIPAAGSMVACGASLNEAKRVDKEPETFGKGNPRGLMAVSVANNAVVGGSLVPLMTLSIPGNGTSAVFLGGLLIHGLKPGVELFTTNASITYTMLFGLIVAQFMILIIGLYFSKYCAQITRIPIPILCSVIMVFTVIGSYAIRNSMFDVFVMLGFGIVGYLLEKINTPLTPFVLAFILGPIAESQLRRALMLAQGDFVGTFLNPLCIVLILVNIVSLVTPFIPDIKAKLAKK